MGSVRTFEDLIVWQRAMDLAADVYRVTAGFPREEIYGLRQQVRNAASSVPSNIAEGQGRGTTKEFLHFLRIARGSLNEVIPQMLLAKRFGYVSEEHAESNRSLAEDVARLMGALVRTLESKKRPSTRRPPSPASDDLQST